MYPTEREAESCFVVVHVCMPALKDMACRVRVTSVSLHALRRLRRLCFTLTAVRTLSRTLLFDALCRERTALAIQHHSVVIITIHFLDNRRLCCCTGISHPSARRGSWYLNIVR